jgi:hypothetical protein
MSQEQTISSRTDITSDISAEDLEAIRAVSEKLRLEREAQKGTGTFLADTLLQLDIQGFPAPLRVQIDRELVLGRADSHSPYIPDVDLAPYGAYRVGISRHHALLRPLGTSLHLIDLGSRNGTMVNGKMLTPGHAHLLRAGDEVLMGTLLMTVSFQK